MLASSGNKYSLIDTGQKTVKWLQTRRYLIKASGNVTEPGPAMQGGAAFHLYSAQQLFFANKSQEIQSFPAPQGETGHRATQLFKIDSDQNHSEQKTPGAVSHCSQNFAAYWKKAHP